MKLLLILISLGLLAGCSTAEMNDFRRGAAAGFSSMSNSINSRSSTQAVQTSCSTNYYGGNAFTNCTSQ